MGVAFETGSVSSFNTGVEVSPFSVEPADGTIDAGQEVSINVRFAPCDVKNYDGVLNFM